MEKYIQAKPENEAEEFDSKAAEPVLLNEETAAFDKEGVLRGLDIGNG